MRVRPGSFSEESDDTVSLTTGSTRERRERRDCSGCSDDRASAELGQACMDVCLFGISLRSDAVGREALLLHRLQALLKVAQLVMESTSCRGHLVYS